MVPTRPFRRRPALARRTAAISSTDSEAPADHAFHRFAALRWLPPAEAARRRLDPGPARGDNATTAMPDVELLEPELPHATELGRIAYEAFRGISVPHGFEADFPDADALALISQITRYSPPGLDVFFCPLRNASLYRATLKSGCRLIKIMTLMTLGPYAEPAPVWMPSIAF